MDSKSDISARGPQRLIETANSQDRFQLLNDPSAPEPDLNIPIHPIFRTCNFVNASPLAYRNLQQSLRLASMFLQHDSMLEWFVRPLLGIPLIDVRSRKTYLSDPFTSKSKAAKKKLITPVQQAFHCLSHCIRFRFVDTGDARFFARTLIHPSQPPHTSVCTPVFQSPHSVVIELRNQNRRFLEGEHSSSSLCDKLRFDFFLAVNLLHEITHALGIMRRGDLNEPFIRLDDPNKSEFGYSWEDFVFGGIFNPFDRTSDRVSFLMQKVWADDEVAYAAGGKEWTAVPMSYIAQWFQMDTWHAIRKRGPTAVSSPAIRLKLRLDRERYTVVADCKDALADVRNAQKLILEHYRKHKEQAVPNAARIILTAKLELVDGEVLQQSTGATSVRPNVPVLVRSQPPVKSTRIPKALRRLASSDEAFDEVIGEQVPSERPRKRVKVFLASPKSQNQRPLLEKVYLWLQHGLPEAKNNVIKREILLAPSSKEPPRSVPANSEASLIWSM
ncbi:hypothetical protein K469DRAFT_754105 [Zopfia rhizophila CBS 207.26]|uniref:Uncharacterized protein n=1 Tax=Zopfia rhizophila CBS 207.26 TaxID=1314779 RepID=A0A6A6DKR3_9PEZI|nr:hypothetical protein K469DRAFT_754105 [Zopfia rhizophila CBS 207.26]